MDPEATNSPTGAEIETAMVEVNVESVEVITDVVVAPLDAAQVMDTSQAVASSVDLIAVFTSLDFYIVSIAVFALITSLKQAVKQLPYGSEKGSAHLLDVAWVNFGLHLLPQVLGAAIALCPGIFDEYTTGMRIILGIIAGFFSEKVVYKVSKQFFPNLLVSDKDETRAAPTETSNVGIIV